MEAQEDISTTSEQTSQEPLDRVVSTEEVNSTCHQRKTKRSVPDTEKDHRYWEKRKRNNMAAKRSRENKRHVESNIRHKVTMLEEENALLRKEVSLIKTKIGVAPNHSFLTEEEVERCRAEVAEEMKAAQAAEAMSMACVRAMSESSASPPPDSTSPHNDMTVDNPENQYNYRYSFSRELHDAKSQERQVNPKTNKMYNYYQKETANRNPTGQAVYYSNPPAARMMVTSSGSDASPKMQQFANPALGYFVSPDQLNNGQVSHFQGQFTRISTAPATAIPHPYEYLWPYGKNGNPVPRDYVSVSIPADLSTTKEKSREERESTRSYKCENFDTSVRQCNPKMTDRESIVVPTLLYNKRPQTVESNDVHNGFGMNKGESVDNSKEAHPVYLLHNQNSHTVNPGYGEGSTGLQDKYFQQDRNANRNPEIARRCSEDNGYSGNFLSSQTGIEGERLRRENDDLKMRLRQLSTQVSKMKDIVLPE